MMALRHVDGVVQERTSFCLSTGEPQLGHTSGRSTGEVPGSVTRSTFGITPPRRTRVILAPNVRPSLSMNPALWSDARVTVTPDKNTGSTTAMGVMAPVRATDHSTAKRV